MLMQDVNKRENWLQSTLELYILFFQFFYKYGALLHK